jgi:hypothetical protein
MSLYREVGTRRGVLAIALVLGIVAGLVGGFALGRATAGSSSLAEQVKDVQAQAGEVRDALELVSIEYKQAHAATEYQAAVEDVQRARESFTEARDGLQLLEPEATRSAEARLAALDALVARRAPAAQVAAAVEQADAAVRQAARL